MVVQIGGEAKGGGVSAEATSTVSRSIPRGIPVSISR